MSKYTTELRFICEQLAGLDESKGYSSTTQIIETARPKIFSFPYPIFDESYKQVLETKIIKHFYTREIGAETFGLWQFWLNRTLNEIMPLYNKLYESELLEFNPFYDVDYHTEGDRSKEEDNTNTGTSARTRSSTGRQDIDVETESDGTKADDITATKNGSNTKWDYYSDTPQGSVQNIENNTYLTNARKNTDAYSETDVTDADQTTHNEGTSNTDIVTTSSETDNKTDSNRFIGSSTGEYAEHVFGKRGVLTYSKMLEEFRNTFLNIDMMIIEELNPLFMNLW